MSSSSRILAALTGASVLLAACDVKEDRLPCPCYLTIDFSRLPERMLRPNAGLGLGIVSSDGTRVRGETISPSDYPAPDWLVEAVPKGTVLVAATTGASHWHADADGRTLRLAGGYESDSLFAHGGYVGCYGEQASDTVRLHKQWCTLTVLLKGAQLWKQYGILIEGKWNGLSLGDMSPLEGNFVCTPRRVADDSFEIRLPRQGDNSLTLSLLESTDPKAGILYTYPLGAYIYRAGYDWFRKDLDDIMITLDYARAEVSVEIKSWDRGVDFGDIEI